MSFIFLTLIALTKLQLESHLVQGFHTQEDSNKGNNYIMKILALKSKNSNAVGGAAMKINTLVMISEQIKFKSSVLN